MSWIKENKFLAGFTAATVVGAGALGFLALQAKGNYDASVASFEEKSAELSRLQNAQPFPSPENVKKLEAQRKEFQQAIDELQAKAAKLELPLEQISAFQFQDRLRQTVDSVAQRASAAQVEIPPNFSLGFERYLSEPPREDAAPHLGRQLKAIEAVVANMIEARVAKINDLKRDELPEEKSGTPAPEPAKGGKGKTSTNLVEKQSFEIAFLSNQSAIMQVLNSVVAAEQQFYIPRVITVRNEKETGPSRMIATGPIGTPLPPPPFGDPNAQPGGDPGTALPPPLPTGTPAIPGPVGDPYIVGQEKADVTMRIDIVDFAETTTAAK